MNNIIPLPFQEHNFLYVGFPMDIVKLPLHDNIFIFLGHIFMFSSFFSSSTSSSSFSILVGTFFVVGRSFFFSIRFHKKLNMNTKTRKRV